MNKVSVFISLLVVSYYQVVAYTITTGLKVVTPEGKHIIVH